MKLKVGTKGTAIGKQKLKVDCILAAGTFIVIFFLYKSN